MEWLKKACGLEEERNFMKRHLKCLLAFVAAVVLLSEISAATGEKQPVKPTREDKCPVCGMFVAKYPDFVAEIIFKDGSHFVFDGAKDMFKYFFNLQKYNPGKRVEDIDSIYVTDYYSLQLIDGRKACFVVGSTVYGPMGKELIPFEKDEDAQEFMVDHAGQKPIRFDEVTIEMVKGLD